MALFSRKDKTAEIVKGVVDELTKAGTIASAMQSGQLNGTPVQTPIPNLAQQVISATPLPRPMSQFGAAFNPGTPLFPGAIDQVNPITGRAEPRVTQYQVAENLMISQEPAPFGRLEWAARNVDIISRCITIRIDDITKMEWSFEVSDDAIAEIMAEENCSHAKASNIARDKHGKQIAEMTEFWSNPFPLEYKNWRAFIAQLMWDYLVYDEVVLYPNYNLGGKCFGFDIIDPSTIKILRDDKGRVPSFPMPAYQQILFGYPRGEFTASPLNEVNAQFNSQEQRGPVRPSDSLNVFIGHPQTKMLYGFSAVEQCLQYTDLYVNRQEWLLAEYKAGSTPAMFLETDSALELWQLADNDRILNDYYSGMTANRHQIRSLPGGAKVVQTTQIDEKYKSDYDEFIAKRIAAIFGVAPSQVGVVARAGLGGGKGSHDGETESAETVSTKPTINFIVDMVNTLCRQHLGMDESITFSLTNDASSTDQLNRYKALSTAVNAGMLTLNDSRGELGMPLFDMNEADEPFILTASGPTFLSGQLTTDATGETLGQTGPSSDNQENTNQVSQGKEQPSLSEAPKGDSKETTSRVEAKSAHDEELREFARFVKSRNKTGKWRAFDFVTIEEELADKLNSDAYFLVKGTVPMPDSVLAWAEDVVKAQISDTPKGLLTKEYNPDQPRDERGRFGSGGGSNSSNQGTGSSAGRPDVGNFQFSQKEAEHLNSVYNEAAKASGYPVYAEQYAAAGQNAMQVEMANMLGMGGPATIEQDPYGDTRPTLFRGCDQTGADSLTGDLTSYGGSGGTLVGSGVYTSPDVSVANQFAKDGGVRVDCYVSPNANIATATADTLASNYGFNAPSDNITSGDTKWSSEAQDGVSKIMSTPSSAALSNGYQGLNATNITGQKATLIFDRSVMSINVVKFGG